MKTVLILFGGKSSEYEVSLSSATGVYENIDKETYRVLLAGITKDGRMYLYEGDPKKILADEWEQDKKAPLTIDFSRGELLVLREGNSEYIHVDTVLPMIHGKYCEDGTMQGLFAVAGIPVAGCSCQASAVCMDKAVAKEIVAAEVGANLAKAVVARARECRSDADIERIREQAEREFGYPMFVKPSRAGSSVGVNKVKNADAFARALRKAFEEDTKVLVEEAVVGREIEVAVLEEGDELIAAHPAEIDVGSSEFYDYETKYISDASSYYLPARLTEEKQNEVREIAAKIFRALDCRGFARVDFFCTPDGSFVFNEINTLPGFTPISMFPKMMMNEGITYSGLIDRLITGAL